MDEALIIIAPLLVGWLLDCLLGDPVYMPHPVVGFGRLIALGERRLNKGRGRVWKGGGLALGLVVVVFAAVWGLRTGLERVSPWLVMAVDALLIFYSLAGKTLRREVREVFRAVEGSLDAGRRQVGRIVGRDTSNLTAHEIRTAALETLAENLSDGVVAPLFWFAAGGVPAMVAYKMINTLDSMIAYRTPRYERFGRVAARLDDAANWIPARLTALLMLVVTRSLSLWGFVRRFGSAHASPNAGWPEAALAAILDCRFGGTHQYFGHRIYKPYIGTHARELSMHDMQRAIAVNRRVEAAAIALAAAAHACFLIVTNR